VKRIPNEKRNSWAGELEAISGVGNPEGALQAKDGKRN
jgi:hypothetical protein